MAGATYIRPVSLWGTEIHGMFQVVKGRTPVALVRPDGRKLKVISVQDRHGGKAGEFGMTAPAVLREIRQTYGHALNEQAAKAVDKAAKTAKGKPIVAEKPRTPVWYWMGGNQVGQWNRAWPETRPALIRMGYYAVEGERPPRQCPPAEWFDNYHRHNYREGMIALG
jgi:hypothetical protein